MNTRWWAPTRPTLEPDAVVLALMAPGGDAGGDLGSVLLAAHRAGAAACSYVAKGAMPSQAGLINALATTRGHLADPMVTTIAKSLDASYAGLLVRDVFDDAEQAAVSLFSSCVAKGVAPPAAADRVGAVFGVPITSLGKYQSLAQDPKANPAALTDGADRALLTFVSRLVDTETAQSGPVAKAVEFKEEDHRRGDGGRFADMPDEPAPTIMQPHLLAQLREFFGGGSQAAPPVAEPAKARTSRTKRTKRTKRLVRAQSETGTSSVGAPTLTPSIRVEVATAQQKMVFAVAEALGDLSDMEYEPARPSGPLPDLLQLPNEGATPFGRELPYTLVFSSGQEASMGLHKKIDTQAHALHDPSAQIFRIGHLLAAAGNPDPHIAGGDEAQKVMNQAGDVWSLSGEILGGDEWRPVKPRVRAIGPDEMAGMKLSRVEDWAESERRKEYTHVQLMPDGSHEVVEDDLEAEWVDFMPQYRPLGAKNAVKKIGSAIVHWQPADDRKPRWRPKETTVEYVVEFPVGTADGPGGNTEKWDFKLDPNVAYKVIRPPTANPLGRVRPEVMFDVDRGIRVVRYYLRAITETEVEEILGDDVSKAQGYDRTQRRDRFGMWTESDTGLVHIPEPDDDPAERTARTSRTTRTRRAKRTRRTVRQSSLGQGTPAGSPTMTLRVGSPTMTPSQSVTHKLIQNLQAAMNPTMTPTMTPRKAPGKSVEPWARPPLPPLNDTNTYKIITKAEFDQVRSVIGEYLGQMDGGKPVTLTPEATSVLLSAGQNQSADQVGDALKFNTEIALADPRTGKVATKPIGGYLPIYQATDDNGTLGEHMNRLYADHPEVDQIEIIHHHPSPTNTITGPGFLSFHGNIAPAPVQYLVEFDYDLDWEKPVQLQYLGDYRSHQVQIQAEQELPTSLLSVTGTQDFGTAVANNPRLQIFKLTNPPVVRLSARNR